MLHEEIMTIHAALGHVFPRVDSETAEVIRLCRRNLAAAAEAAEVLEQYALPRPEPTTRRPVTGVTYAGAY